MRGVKKENLPSKVCVVCDRPFTWRKKWERCWDEVTTCSKSCNAKRRAAKQGNADEGRATSFSASTEIQDDQSRSKVPKPASSDGGAPTAAVNYPQHLTPMGSPSEGHSQESDEEPSGELTEREKRKAAKKAMKAERRAQREGRGDGSAGQKKCDGCEKMVDLLIRCTVDESESWKMMCGKCWQGVSGGVADGDAAHPHYRYGGLRKNRKANRDISTTPPDAVAMEAPP